MKKDQEEKELKISDKDLKSKLKDGSISKETVGWL